VLGVIALVCVLDLTFGRPGKIRTFAQSKSVVIRLDTWGWGLKLAGRSPVVGLGAGGFLPNVSEVSARDMTRKPGFYSDVVVNVHNEPLEIVVELGVLGLLAFLWPIGVLLWGVARLPRDDDAADPLRARVAAFAVGWLALFLHSFLDVGMRFWSVPAVFFTGIGLLSASLRVLGRPEDESATGADAAPRPRTRGAAAYLVMLFLTLLAGACFVICRGFRASLAMQQALHVRDDDTRIGLLTRAADDSVFFIDRVRARKELGRALHEAGKPAAAGDQFKTVIRLAGHFHDTELRLASALFDRDRPEEAMTCIESYARLRPADARTADLIVRYIRRQPPDSVIKVLNEKFLVAHPECSKVHVAAGKIGLMMAPPRTEEARAYFELALETNPADAHAAFLLGLERHKENRLSDAHSLLTASLKLGLRLPELYLELARMERMSGEEERSRRLLREGLDLFPDSPELRKEAETVREART
jgi:Flp pilus assembly protein TadD